MKVRELSPRPTRSEITGFGTTDLELSRDWRGDSNLGPHVPGSAALRFGLLGVADTVGEFAPGCPNPRIPRAEWPHLTQTPPDRTPTRIRQQYQLLHRK